MVLWKTALVFTVCLAAAACARAGGAQDEDDGGLAASKMYRAAHESMSMADWLAERGMREDAGMLYNEALDSFRKLSAQYPDWQTNLVAFRIGYCRGGLDRLNKAVPARASPSPAAAQQAPALPGPTTAAQVQPAPAQLPPADDFSAVLAEASELEHRLACREALERYRTVLARDSQNLSALGGAGRCLLRLGRFDEARDLVFQWSPIPSPDTGVNLLLALIFCRDRQFIRALQAAEAAVGQDGRNAVARVLLGVALAGSGRAEEAISEMRRALEIEPGLAEAHYNLARLTLKSTPGAATAAAAHYRNALKFGAEPDPGLEQKLKLTR